MGRYFDSVKNHFFSEKFLTVRQFLLYPNKGETLRSQKDGLTPEKIKRLTEGVYNVRDPIYNSVGPDR